MRDKIMRQQERALKVRVTRGLIEILMVNLVNYLYPDILLTQSIPFPSPIFVLLLFSSQVSATYLPSTMSWLCETTVL